MVGNSFNFLFPYFCKWNSDLFSDWSHHESNSNWSFSGIHAAPPHCHQQILSRVPWNLSDLSRHLSKLFFCFCSYWRSEVIQNLWSPVGNFFSNFFLSIPRCLLWSWLCSQLLAFVNASSDPYCFNSDVRELTLYLDVRELTNKIFQIL